MSDLLALAERVESFKPKGRYDIDCYRIRELNELIGLAKGMPASIKVGHEVLGNVRMVPSLLPDFMYSIDAATKLVPDGWDWGIANFGPRGSEAQIWPRGDRDSSRKVIGSSDDSAAAALLVAALRARHALAAQDDTTSTQALG